MTDMVSVMVHSNRGDDGLVSVMIHSNVIIEMIGNNENSCDNDSDDPRPTIPSKREREREKIIKVIFSFTTIVLQQNSKSSTKKAEQ